MEGHGTHRLRVLELAHFDKLCFGLSWLCKVRKKTHLIVYYIALLD